VASDVAPIQLRADEVSDRPNRRLAAIAAVEDGVTDVRRPRGDTEQLRQFGARRPAIGDVTLEMHQRDSSHPRQVHPRLELHGITGVVDQSRIRSHGLVDRCRSLAANQPVEVVAHGSVDGVSHDVDDPHSGSDDGGRSGHYPL
jgi:hypothetical protein